MSTQTTMSGLRKHATQLLDLMASVAYKDLCINKRWFVFLFSRILRNGEAARQMQYLVNRVDPCSKTQAMHAWQLLLVRVMAVSNLLATLETELELDHVGALATMLPLDRQAPFRQACAWLQCAPTDSDVPWAMPSGTLPVLFAPLYQIGVAARNHQDIFDMTMTVHSSLIVYMGCLKALFFPWKDVEVVLGEDASVALLRFDDTIMQYITVVATELQFLKTLLPNNVHVQHAATFSLNHQLHLLTQRRFDYANLHAEVTVHGKYALDVVVLANREFTFLTYNCSFRLIPLMSFSLMPWQTPHDHHLPTSLSDLLKPSSTVIHQNLVMNTMTIVSCALIFPMLDAMKWYRELFMPLFMVELGDDLEYFMVDIMQLDTWTTCHVNGWSAALTKGDFSSVMPLLRHMFVM